MGTDNLTWSVSSAASFLGYVPVRDPVKEQPAPPPAMDDARLQELLRDLSSEADADLPEPSTAGLAGSIHLQVSKGAA